MTIATNMIFAFLLTAYADGDATITKIELGLTPEQCVSRMMEYKETHGVNDGSTTVPSCEFTTEELVDVWSAFHVKD